MQLQELSLMELEWLSHHSPANSIRYRLIKAVIKAQQRLPRQAFNYRAAGFSKQQVYQARQRFLQLQEQWDGETIRETIKQSIALLMQGHSVDGEALLQLLERDQQACEDRQRFCLPNAEQLHFLLKSLKEAFFFARDYQNLNRVIALDDFYQSYFQVNEEVKNYLRKVNYSIRFLDWQKLEDIQGITHNYLKKYNTKLSIKTKVSLIRFLIARYFYAKKYDQIANLLQEILLEYSRNPYYYTQEYNSLNLVTFFNNYAHIGYYHKAITHFQLPQLNLQSKSFKANIYAYLGIALDAYDFKTAKEYIQSLSDTPLNKIRSIVLHLIARYYLLMHQYDNMQLYLEPAHKYLSQSKSEELFGEVYSIQFRFAHQKNDYSTIIKQHNSPRFRQFRKNHKDLSAHNFEIRLFYLLAKYQNSQILEETFNDKLQILLAATKKAVNGFLKLKAVENLDRLLATKGIRISTANKRLVQHLYEEIQPFLNIAQLDFQELPIQFA